jgi:addiction module HigA family antidote
MARKKAERLPAIHPGEILLEEVMKPAGISANRLGRDLDIPPGRISEIVAGKRSITPDTAYRLGIYFGMSPQFWLNLQTRYDLQVLDDQAGERIRSRVRPHAA